MARVHSEERRVRLDRDTIVATALGVLDEVGLDGLSTRLLADRLGVASPALYWHFTNKRDLVDAMAEAMLEQAPWPEPPRPGDDVTAWLAERAHAFRHALLSHRDGARVHAGTRPSPAQLPSLDAQAVALTSGGMTPADALRAVLAISRYTIGWVLEEQAAASRPPGDDATTDLSAFPGLHAARDVHERRDPDADYAFGLQALITGLQHTSDHTGHQLTADDRVDRPGSGGSRPVGR